MPQVDETTARQLLELGINRAIAVSGGSLTDFSPSNPATAILEGGALMGSEVINTVNALADTLESKRITYFGLERRQGTAAVAGIQVTLDGAYADPFFLPSGFRFSNGGSPWETTNSLTIAPFGLSGVVTAIALTVGEQTREIIAYPSIPRVAAVTWDSVPAGGQGIESDQEWRARIVGTIRRRDTLLSEDDFEAVIVEALGVGAIALTVGRLKPDKATYGNGFVGCFGMNPDGSDLTNPQLGQIESYLNRKAAMAVVTLWNFTRFPVKVGLLIGADTTANPDLLSDQIFQKVRDYFKTARPGDTILNKAIERRLQDVPGVREGVVSVILNGFAQPSTLPNPWAIATLGEMNLTITNESGEFKYVS